jgi:ribose 5-phosphate isomerase B
MSRVLLTESDIRGARGGVLRVEGEFLLTPTAQDLALKLGVRVEVGRPGEGLARGRQVVAVAADHAGFEMKEALKKHLEAAGALVLDFGTRSREAVDYPDFAHAAARAVSEGSADRAIIVDGAGIGSCMVANKVPGVRAAKCDSLADVENSRRHNDANVLTLSGRLERGLAREMAATWLALEFEGGRHARRVEKISGIERRYALKNI